MTIAAQVIAERGIKGATVRDIGDAAGILSGSLYHHFWSKEQIVLELLMPSIQEQYERSVQIRDMGSSPSDTLARHAAADRDDRRTPERVGDPS